MGLGDAFYDLAVIMIAIIVAFICGNFVGTYSTYWGYSATFLLILLFISLISGFREWEHANKISDISLIFWAIAFGWLIGGLLAIYIPDFGHIIGIIIILVLIGAIANWREWTVEYWLQW